MAKEAGNKAGQGQAYYCLGSTYMLQKNYELAIKHHMEHLALANDLGDKQGQRESERKTCSSRSFLTHVVFHIYLLAVKAYVNLRNAYHAQGNQEKTVYYHKLVQQNSQQVGLLSTEGKVGILIFLYFCNRLRLACSLPRVLTPARPLVVRL